MSKNERNSSSEDKEKQKNNNILNRKHSQKKDNNSYTNSSSSEDDEESKGENQRKNEEEQLNKSTSELRYKLSEIEQEFFIKYIQLKRKGFQCILDCDYFSGVSIFQQCFDLNRKYIKDKIKETDLLINMSICEYYNGNFNNSLSLIEKAKKVYEKIYSEEVRVTKKEKIHLGLKLFTRSSMANLSMNNYNGSLSDIKNIINLINLENNCNKKLSYLKNVIYTLFKVDSLINLNFENKLKKSIKRNSITNNENSDLSFSSKDDEENNNKNNMQEEFMNNNERIMNDFIFSLKHKNNLVLLNSFLENGEKYKEKNDLTGYYYCIFNRYLITYNNYIKENDLKNSGEYDLKELKDRLYKCYENLMGKQLLSQMDDKSKKLSIFLKEFNQKIECSQDIYSILENIEKKLSSKIYNNINNENNSSYLVKISLTYSLNNLYKKKSFYEEKINKIQKHKKNKENIDNKEKEEDDEENENEINEQIKNINGLIKEIEKLIYKINNYEIDVSTIKSEKINPHIMDNLEALFKNLTFIYLKSILYRYFHKFHKKIINMINTEKIEKIDKFLDNNYDKITKGMDLVKINIGSKGHKTHYYNLDDNKNTFNAKETASQQYPKHSYRFFKDIIKVTYGIKSDNLKKKLLAGRNKDTEAISLLRQPWEFFSIITLKRSLDFYCHDYLMDDKNDKQINNWFYGLKKYTDDNNIGYKIISVNKFVLNRVKFKFAMILKKALKEGKILDENNKFSDIILALSSEKGIQNMPFIKLFLFFSKLIDI